MIKSVLLFLVLHTIWISGFSDVITVGPNEKVTKIKEAVLIASPGDTIMIKPGMYREGNIIIQKPITLLGIDFPVLDGENKYEIITIHAENVIITGLQFKDTGNASINDLAAIKILDSKYVKVVNNRFTNTFFGIYLSNSSQSWIENNTLEASATAEHEIGNGIHMWKCHHLTVNNNTIYGHRDGMYFEFTTNSLVTNNVSEANVRYGLHFMFSHNNEYKNNTFKRNGAGVAVMYTKGVKMLNNIFELNWGSASYGLLLKDLQDSEVIGNKFIQNTVGIFMEGTSRMTFTNNTFTANGYAIKLQASCDDNVFSRNNFTRNTFDITTNGSLVLNEISNNYWDRYQGYDLNKDNIGDVPYRPVSMYAMVVERMPTAVLLWRSFLVFLLDRAESAIPVLTPEHLKDDSPQMKPYDFNTTG